MEDAAEIQEGFNVADLDLPSCDGCRRRKLRCSREWPTCSHCKRLTLKCSYEYQRKKPGIKSGAVEALSRRVAMLEDAVFDRGDASILARPCGDQPETQSSQSGAPDHQAMGGILSNLAREINRLNSNLTTTSSIHPRAMTASTPSLSDSPRSEIMVHRKERPNKRMRLHSATTVDLGETHGPTVEKILSRPGLEKELLDAYFDNIHPWVPILHESRFRQNLSDEKHHYRNIVILHAILVASLGLIDEKLLNIPAAEVHKEIKASRNFVLLNGMNDLTLESLQALIIVAFIDIGNNETSKAWPIIASLARIVHYFHLSVEDTDFAEPAALLSNLPRLDPSNDWIEEEERRRIFWNVFLLDRFCSIVTGWNVSLTAEDISRRLPVDGGLWKRNQPAVTPYLGIWDHSAVKNGHAASFLPFKYDVPSRAAQSAAADKSSTIDETGFRPPNAVSSGERLKIGAFAYYVESIESLSRINTHFVQRKIDFTNRQEVSNWLTWFKDLDLRLVHWKMFLPQKWKDPNENPVPVINKAMDPNMTLAHLTHNMSTILLHQMIAYPSKALEHLRLPNTYSADTCYVAATETANITTRYLDLMNGRQVLAPHFAICVFVSAKLLLVHSRYYEVELASEFWTLVNNLETMSLKWQGRFAGAVDQPVPFSGSLARELRQLHNACSDGSGKHSLTLFSHRPQILKHTQGSTPPLTTGPRTQQASNHTDLYAGASVGTMGSVTGTEGTYWQPTVQRNMNLNDEVHVEELRPLVQTSTDQNLATTLQAQTQSQTQTLGTEAVAADELSLISGDLMNQSFLEMNRIINFDDFMFITDPEDMEGMAEL